MSNNNTNNNSNQNNTNNKSRIDFSTGQSLDMGQEVALNSPIRYQGETLIMFQAKNNFKNVVNLSPELKDIRPLRPSDYVAGTLCLDLDNSDEEVNQREMENLQTIFKYISEQDYNQMIYLLAAKYCCSNLAERIYEGQVSLTEFLPEFWRELQNSKDLKAIMDLYAGTLKQPEIIELVRSLDEFILESSREAEEEEESQSAPNKLNLENFFIFFRNQADEDSKQVPIIGMQTDILSLTLFISTDSSSRLGGLSVEPITPTESLKYSLETISLLYKHSQDNSFEQLMFPGHHEN